MKLYICSLLILAVFDGLSCAPSPQQQFGITGQEIRVKADAKLTGGLAVGRRDEDGLFVIQPEINPSFDGSAGYYKSFLPPPGYYPQYSNYQIPSVPQNQLPQQYPNGQLQTPNVPQYQLPQQYPNGQLQTPNVPQYQLPQQFPINQQIPYVQQNQLPQQYPNGQLQTLYVPQNQLPQQYPNGQWQIPYVPQNQLPQQYPNGQLQIPYVPQNQLPQQYPNNQPNNFVSQYQSPIPYSNNQNPAMPQYQPNQYLFNSQSTVAPQYQPNQQQESTRQDEIANTSFMKA